LEAADISVIVPDENKIELIHRAIFSEAVVGKVSNETKALFIDVINELAQLGAQGVILGCTELGLMITPEDSRLPIFDTATLHAEKAVEETEIM